MPTRLMGTFNNGLVEFQVDYDASGRITAVRCINDDDHTVYGEVVQDSNGRKYSGQFLAGTNTYIPVPTSPSQRIQITVDARGHLIGATFRFEG